MNNICNLTTCHGEMRYIIDVSIIGWVNLTWWSSANLSITIACGMS